MIDRQLSQLSENELLAEIAECASLEGEAKARAKPLRDELLKRQVSTGESNIEHDGWQSVLTKQKVSAAWVETEYGYPKEEIPSVCYDEVMKLELNPEKAINWLQEQGHEVRPSYGITVSRIKRQSQRKK